jgi:preprotein translocase subunit SecF
MDFFKFKNAFLLFSGVLMGASALAVAVFGLNLGIEFTGGSLLEMQYESVRPSNDTIRQQLSDTGINVNSIQPIGEKGIVIRSSDISEEKHQEVVSALGQDVQEMRFESIGPVIGKELREKALILTVLSLLAIVVYVTFAFRKIIGPVRSWQWSLAALITLLHDLLIPLGVFAVLGTYGGVQLTIPIVVAFLIVVGYSINDTVVIFDRVRENLTKKVGFDFTDTVNKSLNQSLARSIGTSFTTLLVVVAIFLFGGETLRYFSLAMILGIIAGTSSSLFLAPMLVVRWAGRKD